MRDVTENGVLLFDGDPSIRPLLSMELDIIGFQAQQAEDRIEGIVKLRDELPEIIMSDLQMSPTAGIEFISVVCRRFASPAQRAHQSEAARRQERAAGGIKYE